MRAAVVLAALALAACTMPDPWAEIPELVYESRDPWGISRWVASHIGYAADLELHGRRDYWAPPEETFALGAGDCEDQAILALYLIDRDVGLSGRLVGGERLSIGAEHAWIRVGDTDYEPMFGILHHPELFRECYSLSWPVVRAIVGG